MSDLNYCPACDLPADSFQHCGAPNCAVRDDGPGDACVRQRAAKAPAAQAVDAQDGKYRKKPVVISAVQFTEAVRDAFLFDDQPLPEGVIAGARHLHPGRREVYRAAFYIETLEGRMEVSLNDWIITGIKGEHYPCKPDIFAATYEPAASPASTPEASQQAAQIVPDWPACNEGCDYETPCGNFQDSRSKHCSCEAAKASIARQQAAAVAVPSGYVLVPELPTLEMQKAAMNAARNCVLEDGQPRPLPNGYELWSATYVYRAMIDAAPAPAAAATTSEDARDAGEQWQQVGSYFVSNTGKVSDGERLLQAYLRNEYLAVSIWEDGERIERPIHRLVAEAFCKRMDDAQTQVNHRDADKLNNHASNLEWCSPAENRMHATRVAYIGTRAVIATRISDGKEIRFNSLAEASEAGFKRANIQKVIDGLRKQHGGYTWRDAEATQQEGE